MSTEKMDYMACDLVFVYGTLKEGYGNNVLLHGSEKVCEATTDDKFLMLDAGCPMCIPEYLLEEGELALPVQGEVYRMENPYTLYRLDKLESHPVFYYRTIIKVGGVPCWMYQIPERYRLDTPCEIVEGAYKW